VRANAETYMRQFFHVVDKDKSEVRWQSEWFGKTFKLEELMQLAARFTVAQMLQREDFRTRYEAHQPLGVHELLYPMLQAYDSVVIEADVEFGGSDQLFNLLVGRELQQEMGQRPQSCFIMKLLVGTDGSQKMSKSVGNTIDFEDLPNEKYGKLMSIPDSALLEYLELATDIPDEELAYLGKQIEQGGPAVRDIKKRLAREVVSQFDGDEAAREAEAEFERVFSKREEPGVIQDIQIKPDPVTVRLVVNTATVLVEHGLAASKAEARRLIRQGAVEIGGRVVSPDDAGALEVSDGDILRVGKHRFLRLVAAEETS